MNFTGVPNEFINGRTLFILNKFLLICTRVLMNCRRVSHTLIGLNFIREILTGFLFGFNGIPTFP